MVPEAPVILRFTSPIARDTTLSSIATQADPLLVSTESVTTAGPFAKS